MTIEATKAQESNKEDITFTKSGEPFKTVAAAKSARAIRGWSKSTHDIVKSDTGFGIKRITWDAVPEDVDVPQPEIINLKEPVASSMTLIAPTVSSATISQKDKKIILDFHNNDAPFNTRQDAEKIMIELQISGATHVVIPIGDGFGIARMAGVPDPETEKKRLEAAQDEKFFMVKIHSPSTDNEENVAKLGCNGEILLVKRGEEVPLPQRFIEVLEHGVRDHYKFEPGRPRKSVGKISTYPYEKGKEVSREFFEQWRRKGTEQNIEHWMKQGLGAPERR